MPAPEPAAAPAAVETDTAAEMQARRQYEIETDVLPGAVRGPSGGRRDAAVTLLCSRHRGEPPGAGVGWCGFEPRESLPCQ